MVAPSFYNLADQNIYNQGFSFIPQEQFRGGAFKIPGDGSVENDTFRQPTGITSLGGGGGGGGDYAASLGLGPDSRGYMGNFQDINFNDRYSYTPQGITIEDLSKPSNIGDFAVTAAPSLSDQSGYIRPAPEIFQPQKQNMFQKAFGSIKNKAAPIFGGILSAATGIPFLGAGLNALSKNFEKRELGAGIIDEFGNFYDEDELNKQNALGGYYTEAARSARRRTSRIANMLERQRLGKKISAANLAKLQAQEKAQEAARQAAADAMQAENRDRGRGGYQAGYDSDFMDGPGADGGNDNGGGGSPGSSGPGGSDSMGSFAYGGRVPYMMGGLTDLVDIYD